MAKKYIDADRLCVEIEKRKNICDGVFERDSDTYYQGKAVAYQETLSLIDSLQQEQPSEDLEEEMERFLANVTPSFKDGSYRITRYGFRAVARHFYELGKQSKEPVTEDLEEATDAYDRTQPYKVIPAEAFKAGAEWGAEHLKK